MSWQQVQHRRYRQAAGAMPRGHARRRIGVGQVMQFVFDHRPQGNRWLMPGAAVLAWGAAVLLALSLLDVIRW